MPSPFITVVIPTLNEEHHLAACVEGLLADPYPRDRLEVLVVDGGSRDGTLRVAADLARRYPMVRSLANPHKLQSAAFNLAMQAAPHADYLLRCDAHADYPANFITKAVEVLRDSGAAVAVFGDAPKGETCFQKAVAFAQNTALGVGRSHYRLGNYSGFVDHGKHGCFRREPVMAVGGYDESFSHNEDSELSHRLLRAGHRLWLDTRLTVGYYPRRTPWALARQYWLYGRGRRKTVRKHAMLMKPRQIAPVALALALPTFLLLAFWSAWFLLWFVGYFALIVATSGGAAIRQRQPCLLLAIIAFPVMHYAWGFGFIRGMLE